MCNAGVLLGNTCGSTAGQKGLSMMLLGTAITDFTESNGIWWGLPTRQKVLETRSWHYCTYTTYLVVSFPKAAVANVTSPEHCEHPEQQGSEAEVCLQQYLVSRITHLVSTVFSSVDKAVQNLGGQYTDN